MPTIPEAILGSNPPIEGLTLIGRGKVRDRYALPDRDNLMLVVASDRVSIFDIVLNSEVPEKGAVLTALSHFWDRRLTETFPTDFVACGAAIDNYLPPALQGNIDLHKRATVVRILPSPQDEDIVRFILTGSGWASYQRDGTVCGHRLPHGLRNGDIIPFGPIYTPSTKADVGHDEHEDVDSVVARRGPLCERRALQAANLVATYAQRRGILLGDLKWEWSGPTMIDEKATPDSSRYFDLREYERARAEGKLPPSLDKQYVRDWGKSVGIDGSVDVNDPEQVARAQEQLVPAWVLSRTTKLYRYIFWRLTGYKLEQYQRDIMEIRVSSKLRKIRVVTGSESDLEQIESGMREHRGLDKSMVHIISCHRNPSELARFAQESSEQDVDAIVACAGMAAALPGVLKSQLCMLGREDIPVIGVALKGQDRRADEAAILSIEQLPGQPVELDPDGRAYFGVRGVHLALQSAKGDEFIPKGFSRKPTYRGTDWISNG